MPRALTTPGTESRLALLHTLRVGGVVFLLYMALGHLPALFALPAGLGDTTTGIAAPLVARRLAQGTGRPAALWFNAFGMTDLVVAGTLDVLTQLLNVTPSAAPISEPLLVLIPTAAVPSLFAPAHHVRARAGQSPANPAASQQPAYGRRRAAYRGGGKPGAPLIPYP